MSDHAYSNNNPEIFKIATKCSTVNGDVTLRHNTWKMHIKTGHPEVANALNDIQGTVQDPHYVAHSLPGKEGSSAGNLVFVSKTQNGRSALHVFVGTPTTNPVVATAFYARKSRHAQVVWRALEEVEASYDRDADILYISKNRAETALTEEDDNGLLLRYSLTTDKPCGVTVRSFSAYWANHQDELASEVSNFLSVSSIKVERVIQGSAP